MSVFIEFKIQVSGHDPEHEEAVLDAMEETAPIQLPDDYHYIAGGQMILILSGQGSCSYRSLEEDFLRQEIVPAITAANGGKTLEIEATVRWLENCPYDTFQLSGNDEEEALSA